MNETKKSAIPARLLTAICSLALLIGALPAGAAPDCRGRLQFDEEYSCQFRSDLSAVRVDGTLLFEEFDGNAFQATLALLGESSVAHCTCKVRQPDRFDRAKAFECVSGFGNSAAETFEATLTGNGNEILKGQLWSADPLGSGFARFVFDCALSDADDDQDSDDADDDSDSDSDDDSDSDGEEKVVLCHKGRRTLEVPASSVQNHLNHGDTLGPCESDSD